MVSFRPWWEVWHEIRLDSAAGKVCLRDLRGCRLADRKQRRGRRGWRSRCRGRCRRSSPGRAQRLDAHLLGAGAVHDRTGSGHVLWRPGPTQERAQRAHAVHFSDGADDRPVGHLRLFARLRRQRTTGRIPTSATGEYLFMQNVQREWVPSEDGKSGAPETPMYVVDDATNSAIPLLTHMLFQGMFFIITPALIWRRVCRADEIQRDGRLQHPVGYDRLLSTLPLGVGRWHPRVWGGRVVGWRARLDFAGGTVVHISSGVSALMCAVLIGRRGGWGQDDMRPHNLTYTAIGAGMLWVGWFGFNAGRRTAKRPPHRQRIRRHTFLGRGRRRGLGRLRVDHPWQAKRPGCCVGCGRRSGVQSPRPPGSSTPCPRS